MGGMGYLKDRTEKYQRTFGPERVRVVVEGGSVAQTLQGKPPSRDLALVY